MEAGILPNPVSTLLISGDLMVEKNSTCRTILGILGFKPCGRGRWGFQRGPNIRGPKIASKTPDKDKMRCHYFQGIGHFAKECKKRIKDEEWAAQ